MCTHCINEFGKENSSKLNDSASIHQSSRHARHTYMYRNAIDTWHCASVTDNTMRRVRVVRGMRHFNHTSENAVRSKADFFCL